MSYRNGPPGRFGGRGNGHFGNGYDRRGRPDERGPPRGEGPHYRGGGRGRGPDRSRSRDRQMQPPPPREHLERHGVEVKTNQYRITASSPSELKWYQYHAQIFPGKRGPAKNEKGEVLRDDQGKVKDWIVEVVSERGFFSEGLSPPNAGHIERNDKSSNLSRRILKSLAVQLKEQGHHHFVHVGTNHGFAPSPLFDKKPAPSQVGMYGPADDGTSNRPAAKQEAPFQFYDVRVKRECEDDDWQGQFTKNRWFKVKLTQVGEPVGFPFVQEKLRTSQSQEDVFLQLLNIAINNSMLTKMLAFGRSPKTFFYPPEEQTSEICGKLVERLRHNIPSHLGDLFVGLTQAAHITRNKDLLLIPNFVHSFIRAEKTRTIPPQAIKILQPNRKGPGGILAGVEVPDLYHSVPDNTPDGQARREKIEHELRKFTFHVHYECGPRWVAKMRRKGMDETRINKIQKSDRRRNQRVYKSTETEGPSIIWAADDKTLHSFPKRDEEGKPSLTETHTVASYFESRYDIKLQYPKMPVVRISRNEYFPVEFLRQALGQVRGADTESHKNLVLKLYDEFGSTERVNHTTRLLRKTAEARQDILGPLQLDVEDRPLECRAKVLQMPKVIFANMTAQVQDGSWNLNKTKFKKAAEMNSFAVINLTVGNARETSISAEAVMEGVFDALSRHNVRLPNNLVSARSIIPHVLVQRRLDEHGLCGQLELLFEEAKTKATKYFMHDVHGVFRQNKVFFRTLIRSRGEQTRLEECLICPLPEAEDAEHGIPVILPDPTQNSHKITLARTGQVYPARLGYSVEGRNWHDLVDIFDLRLTWEDGRRSYKAKRDNSWVNVTNVEIVYRVWVDGEPRIVPESEVKEEETKPIAQNVVALSDIELPSVVFVILPERKTDQYNLVKFVSNCVHGVQSQVIVGATVQSQRRGTDQYFSNIAAKLNAKLSNGFIKACAWGTASGMPLEDGLPWASECPTLIMGYSMSAAKGQDSRMIVAATACLDNSGMRCCQDFRIQEKASTVSSYVLEDLTKNLAVQYYLDQKRRMPKRLLVYRAGGQDGLFPEIIDTELRAIRKAFYNKNNSCDNEQCKEGCHLCCPFITFIVAQTQHGIQVVPAKEERGGNGIRNVPSGTCVDDSSVVPAGRGSMQLFADTNAGFEFLLISHGGLKGTSNSVFYRTLWNENYTFHPESSPLATRLTGDNLQRLTYAMSFNYATATKAPRHIPVLLYSNRLAKCAMGYKDYVRLKENDTLDVRCKVFVNRSDEEGTPDARVLPHFSPYTDGAVPIPEKWRIPFRPHLSA